ncbi:hypothetical protein MTO96_051276 [Rhipicephalus appendiculatus]
MWNGCISHGVFETHIECVETCNQDEDPGICAIDHPKSCTDDQYRRIGPATHYFYNIINGTLGSLGNKQASARQLQGDNFFRWRERRKKLEAQSCCDTTDSAEESTLLHEDPASQEGELLESLPSVLDDNAEERTLLHEDTVSQEGELLESLPSALDDSAEESTLLHEDTVSQEGQLLESLPSALDVLCMAIDAVEAMKEDKDDFVELLSLLRAALRVNVQAIHFFHVAYM